MELNYLTLKRVEFVRQEGMVLVVGLVMVLLLSIIGLAAIRGSGLQEAMAGNMREKNMAFQAAESSLRVCEDFISAANRTPPSPSCLDGLGSCLDLNAIPAQSILNDDAFWRLKSFKTAITNSVNKPVFGSLASQPSCIIEELDVDVAASAAAHGSATGRAGSQATGAPFPYRVTALGSGSAQNTEAVTQTSYNRLFQ